MEVKKTRIAAVGDIHVREGERGKWTEYFKEVSSKADVLVIAGDLTDTGDEMEAEVPAEELKACTIPVVAVLGNHDFEKGRHKLIRQVLLKAGVHLLDGEAVVIAGVGFAGVKGFACVLEHGKGPAQHVGGSAFIQYVQCFLVKSMSFFSLFFCYYHNMLFPINDSNLTELISIKNVPRRFWSLEFEVWGGSFCPPGAFETGRLKAKAISHRLSALPKSS